MLQHMGTLKTLCHMKGARYKWSHILSFYVSEIFKTGKTTETEIGCQVREERRVGSDYTWGAISVLELDDGNGYKLKKHLL